MWARFTVLRSRFQLAAHPLQYTRTAEWAPWFLFALTYALLSNLPFRIASFRWQFLSDGWFSPEYAAAGVAALFLPRILASALLTALIAGDVMCGVCRTYFLSPAECLRGLNVVQSLSLRSLLIAAALLISTVLVIFISDKVRSTVISRRDRALSMLCLCAFAAICLGTDCAWEVFTAGRVPNPLHPNNQFDARRAVYLRVPRLARIPLIRLVGFQRFHFGLKNAEEAGVKTQSRIPSAMNAAIGSAGVRSFAPASGSPNVVLVLLESWGASTDQPIADALDRPYTQPDLLAQYDVRQGIVPFYGGTVAGEARELCGSTMGFHLLDASPTELAGCLPQQFDQAGYRTIAVHGNTRYFFDRLDWYPRMGFSEIVFRRELKQLNLPDCAEAFVGVCDASVADWIEGRLAQGNEPPSFVYWVTLNSHLPVTTPTPLDGQFSCAFDRELTSEPALCAWYQLVANVHRSVVQMAESNLARPTIFVVVGDHTPPFANPALRSRFSAQDVPFTILTPRVLLPRHGQRAPASSVTLRAAERVAHPMTGGN